VHSGVCDVAGGTCVAETALLYASPAGGASSACSRLRSLRAAKAFLLVDGSKNIIKIGAARTPPG